MMFAGFIFEKNYSLPLRIIFLTAMGFRKIANPKST